MYESLDTELSENWKQASHSVCWRAEGGPAVHYCSSLGISSRPLRCLETLMYSGARNVYCCQLPYILRFVQICEEIETVK